MNDITKLKALAEAACPRDEWYEQGDLRYCDDKTGETHGLHHHDAAFVESASPAAVLELIERIERLEGDGDLSYAVVLAERRQLKAENFDLGAGRQAAEDEIARIKAENESLRQQLAIPSDVLADCEALRLDAERYRWLREQEALEGGIAILPVGLWVKPAMVCTTPFDSGEMTDSVVDAAMSKEASHD